MLILVCAKYYKLETKNIGDMTQFSELPEQPSYNVQTASLRRVYNVLTACIQRHKNVPWAFTWRSYTFLIAYGSKTLLKVNRFRNTNDDVSIDENCD